MVFSAKFQKAFSTPHCAPTTEMASGYLSEWLVSWVTCSNSSPRFISDRPTIAAPELALPFP
jgi:hypothetical protein